MQLILDVENLVKEFPSKGNKKNGVPRAIDDISFQVFEGEALGLVGESGSGKSTTARCIFAFTETHKWESEFSRRKCTRNG
jgi:ABC-type oligopeptide transport system ATPase subunit